VNLEQFGQKIKAKYPEYQDMPDAELGRKMLDKYPQYRDMVTEEPERGTSFMGRLAMGMGPVGLATPEGRETIAEGARTVTDVLFPRTKKFFTEDYPAHLRDVAQTVKEEGLAGAMREQYQPETYLEALRMAAPAAGELGVWALPAFKARQGAGAFQKVLAGGKSGLVSGGILGLTAPGDLTAKERLAKAGEGALAGAVTGAAITGAVEGGKALTKAVLKQGAPIIRRLFKPPVDDVAEFTRNTGYKFEDEILKRDGEAMRGKRDWELVNYFRDRYRQAKQAVGELIAGSPKTEGVDKGKFIGYVKEEMAKLNPEKGNVLQTEAVSSLQRVLDDLDKAPDNLSPEMINRMKLQLQDAASSAYDLNGHPTAGSKAIAGVAERFKAELEHLIPAVKEANKDIQLYWLASRSLEKRLNQLEGQKSGDVFGKILGMLPFFGTGVGYVAGGIPGALATGGSMVAGSLAKSAYEKPASQVAIARTLNKLLDKTTKASETQALKTAIDVLTRMGIIGVSKGAVGG